MSGKNLKRLSRPNTPFGILIGVAIWCRTKSKAKQNKAKSIKKHHGAGGGNERVWTLHFSLGYIPPAKCCAISRPVYQFA